MTENIDTKFLLRAMSRSSRKTYTEQNAVVFLARDLALQAALQAYHNECERLGAADAQLEGVRMLLQRVEQYQSEHPSECKVADMAVPWPTL